DEAFTLSGRLRDARGQEFARSSADVAFASLPPRRNLLSVESYSLPFAVLVDLAQQPITLEIVAYAWQQDAERIVSRHFVESDGTTLSSLTLPLTFDPSCNEN